MIVTALNSNPTVDALRRAIEHAPAASRIAPDLSGWWTPDGFYVCAPCAGRIMARGCALPKGSLPVWQDDPRGVCVTHESDTADTL